MNILEETMRVLDGGALNQIGQVLGADTETVGKGVTAAVPAILSSLQTQAQSDSNVLLEWLSHNFKGDLLDDITGFLNNPAYTAMNMPNLLGSLFGTNLTSAYDKIGKASGLSAVGVEQLLQMVAPLVLSMLGKTVSEKGLTADAFTTLLGDQLSSIRNNAPGLMGFLERIDANDDGSIVDDVSRLLGNWFGKKSE
jgi:hypothetical protein